MDPKMIEQLKAMIAKFDGAGEKMLAIEQKLAEIEAKVAASPGLQREFREGIWDSENQANKFVDFVRAVTMGGMIHGKATTFMNEGNATDAVDSEGAYIVPQEFNATLLRIVEQYGVARQEAFRIPLRRDELKFPTLTSGVTAYWPGEAAPLTQSKPAFSTVTLSTKKMAILVQATSELVEDSSIEIASLLATLVGEAIAKEEDRVAFTGVVANSDPFEGLLTHANTVAVPMPDTKTTFGALHADNLLDLANGVSSSVQNGGAFYMHRTIFDVVRKLKDEQGQYIWLNPGNNQNTVWGYPVRFVEAMPAIGDTAVSTPFILFGNLGRYFYMTDRRRITMSMSQHVGFTTDTLFWKWTQRIGFYQPLANTVAALVTAAS